MQSQFDNGTIVDSQFIIPVSLIVAAALGALFFVLLIVLLLQLRKRPK